MGHDGLVLGSFECAECCPDCSLDGRVVDEEARGDRTQDRRCGRGGEGGVNMCLGHVLALMAPMEPVGVEFMIVVV